MNACLPVSDAPAFEIAASPSLRWKRVRAIRQDLMRGLELTQAETCSEIGLDVCYDLVHLVALGGNAPVIASMYKPIEEPTVTTPISLDRVVLHACGRRVDLDAAAQADAGGADDSGLLTSIDLNAAAIASTSPGVSELVTRVYRQLLTRNPTAEEQAALEIHADDDVDGTLTAAEFAKLACYAVGTTSEFLFQ